MARGKHRSIFDKFLEHQKGPVFTMLLLVTIVAVWAAIIADLLHTPENWGGLAQFVALIDAPMLGLMVSGVFGAIATVRGEYRGGEIALIGMGSGIVLWLSTILFFYLKRGGHLWL
jgi:hypothetical protein